MWQHVEADFTQDEVSGVMIHLDITLNIILTEYSHFPMTFQKGIEAWHTHTHTVECNPGLQMMVREQ